MTRQQFRVLYREFLFRMVDLEVLSAHALGDSHRLLGQFAALLLFVSMLLSGAAVGFLSMKVPPLVALGLTAVSEHFLIATTMLVVGLFAVLSWDSTFPDRRDVLVLAPLPVRAGTLFLAKVAAVATALTLTVVCLHGASGLIWPVAFASQARPVRLPSLAYDATAAPVSAAGLEAVLTRDLHQQLSSGFLALGGGGGLTIGVSKDGESRVFAYGAARPDSLFEIGSITKTFTALILAQMAVQGQVSLHDPIRGLLPPDLVRKPRGEEITLLDLATHHSGLPGASPLGWLEHLVRHGTAKPPKTPFLYSNMGFVILGALLAERSGGRYSEVLRDQVTGPLDLADTVVLPSVEQRARLLAGSEGTLHPVAEDTDQFAGAGAIRSTAGDILKYLEANLHPERLPGTLPKAIALTHQAYADGPPGVKIGLAWMRGTGSDLWSHGGATTGFTSNAFFNPKGGYAAVVLLNHGPDSDSLAELLAAHIRQRLEGKPAASLESVLVPASTGFTGLLRWFAAYWFTMLAAGGFVYCGVLGVQGLTAQLLPRRWYLRLSGVLQLGAFCLFVSVYFLQPQFSPGSTIPEAQRMMNRLPSYWFLGLMHQLNGSMHPAALPLAHRAWLGLAVVGVGTAVAYGLSYLRTLRQIVEEPDIVGASRMFHRLPKFGSRLQTAIGQFSVRTLARSRQHRMILAFYLGIGLAFTIFLLKEPAMKPPAADARTGEPWREANTPLLAASVMMMVLAVVGTRVVFSLPRDLRSNWIFRVTGVEGGRGIPVAGRRALLLLSVGPVWLVSAVSCLILWPWVQAAGHVAVVGLLGMIFADLAFYGFRKIPFTCSYLPGKSRVNMVFLGAIGVMWLVTLSVKVERRALLEPRLMAVMLGALGVTAAIVRGATVVAARWEDRGVEFEDSEAPAVQELGLHRDGVMPVG